MNFTLVLLAFWTVLILVNTSEAHSLPEMDYSPSHENKQAYTNKKIGHKKVLATDDYDLDQKVMKKIDESSKKAFDMLKNFYRKAARSRYG